MEHELTVSWRRRLGTVALMTAAIAGCADDGPDRRTVDEYVEQPPSEPVEVEGFLLIDGNSTRLCSAVAESYPPQCGGSSIVLDGFDPAAVADVVTHEGDVSWLEGAILVLRPTGNDRATFVAVVGP